MFYTAFIALAAFLFSLLGTRLLILTLRKKRVLLDIPNLRSNHKNPVPRGGGLAVVMTLLIYMLAADATYSLILAISLLAAISLLDDWIHVSPVSRLLVQAISVLIVIESEQMHLFPGVLPAVMDVALLTVLWVWFINLFNFMDGIDGLAASEMITVGLGLCLTIAIVGTFPAPLPSFALIVAAAGFGFLWWNWHPAKIFLGDVGSIPIGFVVGYMLFSAVQQDYVFAALILPAYFVADSTVTLMRRLYQGKRVWQAHSEHYYQQAVRAGKRHDQVTRYVAGVNLLLILLAVFAQLFPDIGWLCLLVAYGMVGFVLRHFARLHVPAAA